MLDVDQAAIAETVARSWYRYTSGDDELRHPFEGETIPDVHRAHAAVRAHHDAQVQLAQGTPL